MTGILKVDQIQLNDGSTPTAADLGLNVAGGILQVVQNKYLGEASTTSLSYSALTSISITPKFASSSILLLTTWNVGGAGSFRINRNGTYIFQPAINYMMFPGGQSWTAWDNGPVRWPAAINHYDSPNTTSTVTYQFEWRAYDSKGIGINENAASPYNPSQMVLLEIAG